MAESADAPDLGSGILVVWGFKSLLVYDILPGIRRECLVEDNQQKLVVPPR